MKNFKIFCLLALLLSTSGCKKWLDVNKDPATPQTTAPEFYLGHIIARMAMMTTTDYRDAQFRFTQNIGAQTALNVFERHGYTSSDVGGAMWRFVYVDAGNNLEDMIKKSESAGVYSLAGIGYAIKAWGYQMLTESHGPIVLDEAFKDQLTFKYQDQPEVYAKVREWAQIALTNLNKTDQVDYSAKVKANDFLFGGDKAKWKKFVYGLLAQQYSHFINKPQFKTAYADSVVKYVDLSFAASSEDATIGFTGASSADASPLSVVGSYLTTALVGQPIVSYLTGGVRGTPATNPTSSIDPRLSRMINPMVTPTVAATNGVYRGVVTTKGDVATTKTIPFLYGIAVPTAAAPYPGKYLFGQGLSVNDKPRFPLITYSQLQFIKSEALYIKGDRGGAYTSYRNGILGHMDFVNLYGRNGLVIAPLMTAAEISAYMSSSEVAQNSGELTIADIMGQKYIAQWGWAGQEQWTDMRKYHYDVEVFKQFKPLEPSEFFTTNGYAYRIRPRYNSEYMWNKAEMDRWEMNTPQYTSTEMYFSTPN